MQYQIDKESIHTRNNESLSNQCSQSDIKPFLNSIQHSTDQLVFSTNERSYEYTQCNKDFLKNGEYWRNTLSMQPV